MNSTQCIADTCEVEGCVLCCNYNACQLWLSSSSWMSEQPALSDCQLVQFALLSIEESVDLIGKYLGDDW